MYEETADTFLYFAYGSNLLKRRIRNNDASAEFIGIGRLEDHQLGFLLQSEKWRGAMVTVVEAPRSHVWGAIWRINLKNMPALDRQEGVDTNHTYSKIVTVVTPENITVKCRTYQQTKAPPVLTPGEDLPMERRPSSTYMQCVIKGAKECQLPEYYIENLKKIPHNGQEATPELIELLR